MNEKTGIPADYLKEFCTRLLIDAGAREDIAKRTAELLVETDLHGIHTHGTIRIPVYCRRIISGQMNGTGDIACVKDTEATALLDGNNCPGHVVAYEAMKLAVEKSETSGIGIVVVRNSNHIGELGLYARIAAANGKIGLVTTNAAALMAPTGGKGRLLGNNPFSFGIPVKPIPVIVDISCSQVAGGKVLLKSKEGNDIPQGWVRDKFGNDTLDSNALFGDGGSLVPLGEHKGYGLSLAMEFLTAGLSSDRFSFQIKSLYSQDKDDGYHASHCFLVINPNFFISDEQFAAHSALLISTLQHQGNAKEGERVFLPGEQEHMRKVRALEYGLDLPSSVVKELEQYALEREIEIPEFL